MGLDFEAESLDDLRARYMKAVDHVHDARIELLDPELRASIRRRHVFVFEDGVRIIVSAERLESTPKMIILMISGSANDGSFINELKGQMERLPPEALVNWVIDRMKEHYMSLAGDQAVGLTLAHLSPKYVVHFVSAEPLVVEGQAPDA